MANPTVEVPPPTIAEDEATSPNDDSASENGFPAVIPRPGGAAASMPIPVAASGSGASRTQRLLIVSNRLPITLKNEHGKVSFTRSAGGLATAMAGPHEESKGLWIGWPGDASSLTKEQRTDVERQMAEQRIVPLFLSKVEVEKFYEQFSNNVLWPFFHYLTFEKLSDLTDAYNAYVSVNRRFADLVASKYQPGDMIWVHDYQLCLVPGMLRQRLPDARIGFFLHIPFPTSEIFRILPWRSQLLEGLLGADIIGFHTFSYARAFLSSTLHVLGVASNSHGSMTGLHYQGRDVHVGAYPIGIDSARFIEDANDEGVAVKVEQVRNRAPGQKILLGVDRLDYTKGINRRLLAFEQLLKTNPQLLGRVRFIQVAVPSRTSVDMYDRYRKEVDELVGRINGTYGTFDWMPVYYLYQAFPQRDVVALYRAADVMVVTPVRDGMNLVAKEFVVTRTDDLGVLLLSEFAGASSEMGEAMIVNPYDIEGTAGAMKEALEMDPEEQRARMSILRARITKNSAQAWGKGFVQDLRDVVSPRERTVFSSNPELAMVRAELGRHRESVFFLDYDGTLVPHVGVPRLAKPDARLRALISALTARPGTIVHIVSGRRKETLEEWLGDLPVGIHAEHGAWSRMSPGEGWECAPRSELHRGSEWRETVKDIMDEFTARTPGSFVEDKTAGLAWHYRMADSEFGQQQANELQLHLMSTLANGKLEILPGSKVIEVREQGVNKGNVVTRVLAQMAENVGVLAIGDDRTDEDMFSALPDGAVSIKVGEGQTAAKHRVPNYLAVIKFLRTLAPDGMSALSPSSTSTPALESHGGSDNGSDITGSSPEPERPPFYRTLSGNFGKTGLLGAAINFMQNPHSSLSRS